MNTYYSNNNNAARPNLLRLFLGGVFVCIVAIGLVTLIAWLVLRPALPRFRLLELRVSDFNTHEISGNWNATFLVRNRNKKMGVSYSGGETIIRHNKVILAKAAGPEFEQQPKETRKVFVSLRDGQRQDPSVETAIIGNLKSRRGSFHVEFISFVRFSPSVFQYGRRLARVSCPDVRLYFPSTSSGFLNRESPCRVTG